jgi:hypothetical protein
MPETLWEGAVELAKLYGVSPVQKILRIDYRGLQRRTLGILKPAGTARAAARAPARSFIELPSLPAHRAEHLVELEI